MTLNKKIFVTLTASIGVPSFVRKVVWQALYEKILLITALLYDYGNNTEF